MMSESKQAEMFLMLLAGKCGGFRRRAERRVLGGHSESVQEIPRSVDGAMRLHHRLVLESKSLRASHSKLHNTDNSFDRCRMFLSTVAEDVFFKRMRPWP